MEAKQLKAWRKTLGLGQKEAAEALGLKRRIFQYYEKGERDGRAVKTPKTVRLACWAVAQGIADYLGPDKGAERLPPPKPPKAAKPAKAGKSGKTAKPAKAEKPAKKAAKAGKPARAEAPAKGSVKVVVTRAPAARPRAAKAKAEKPAPAKAAPAKPAPVAPADPAKS